MTEPYLLIQKIIDAQENMIIITEDEKPVMMNRSFCDFFNVRSFEDYQKNFGAFTNSFVPHPSYFHTGKVEEGRTWIETLEALDEKDRIVSMLNTAHEPRAFSVKVDNSHPAYAVLSFEDISANLIKCIMIENDVNIDKRSGAYTKEYFLHTSEILQDGAAFNEKEIGLTMISILDGDETSLADLVKLIKGSVRQNDMLIKWSSNMLLMAYLVDEEDNAMIFSKKLQDMMVKERSRGINFNIYVTLVKKSEKLTTAVARLSRVMNEADVNKLRLI